MQFLWICLILLNLLFYSCGASPVVRPHGEFPQAPGQGAVDGGTQPAGGPAERLWRQARALMAQGAFDAAAENLRAYLKASPWGTHAPEAWMVLADIAMKKGQTGAAVSMYRQVLDRFPEFEGAADAKRELMAGLLSLKRYGEVVDMAPDPADPEDVVSATPEVFAWRGDALREMGDLSGAAEAYATASLRAEDPVKGDFSQKLSAVLEAMPPAEISDLVDRFDADPPRATLLFGLGMAYRRASDTDAAEAVFSTFLDLYPNHPLAAKAKTGGSGSVDASAGQGIAGTPEPPTEPSLTLGVLLPLSGRMEPYGRQALRGIEFALGRFEKTTPTPRVSLMIQDTAVPSQDAKAGMTALASGGALAVIGPMSSVEGAAEVAEQRRVPIITLTQKDDTADLGAYVFRNFLSPTQQVGRLTTHAVGRMGLRRFAVLYPDEKYGRTFLELFGKSVIGLNAEVVQSLTYDPATTDFTALVENLAKSKGKFDALFIPDEPAKVGLILPQLADHALGNLPLLGTNLWHDERLIQMAGDYATGVVIPDGFFAESRNPVVRDFTLAFRAAYGQAPGFLEAVAYDSAMMVLGLIGQGAATPEAIQAGLSRLDAYAGVTGETAFNAVGDAIKSLVLLGIEGNQFVERTFP